VYIIVNTRLQWSEILNSDIYNITLGCIVSITSRKFTVVNLSDDWEDLLELIYDLHINGMSNRDISEYLNSNNYKPRRTDKFSTNLVWILLKKYKIRLQKKNEVKIKVEEVGYWIRG
jgi:hypothetical protein